MLTKLAKFVKIEHTLFSLPMLFAGAALALPWGGFHLLDWRRLGLIVVAGTGARAAALALNRLFDRKIDARNPRTAMRELPSGALSVRTGWIVVAVGSLVYLAAAWALAPLGGALGYSADFPPPHGVLWLGAFAFCWVAGFDVLYATLDEDFDRQAGLFSIPASFGRGTAQDMGLVLHGAALLCLAALTRETLVPAAGPWAWVLMAPAGVLLLLEQRFGYSLEPGSPFFTINAWIGVAVAAGVIIGLQLGLR